MLGQRRVTFEAQTHAAAESVTPTYYELGRKQARSEALKRTVEMLSARLHQPRPIRMDPLMFDETTAHTIVHWLLAVGDCGVVQFIEDDNRMVS